MKILFVGQAPGKSWPLGGRVTRRIERLGSIEAGEFLRRAATANVLPAFVGKAGKGDWFPAALAERAATRLVKRFTSFDRVVLCGRAVAAACCGGVGRPGWFDWLAARGAAVAIMPHHSGVNRWWNDPANVRRARRFLRALFLETGR